MNASGVRWHSCFLSMCRIPPFQNISIWEHARVVLMGLLAGFAFRSEGGELLRLFLARYLGGFTTVSAFSLDALLL